MYMPTHHSPLNTGNWPLSLLHQGHGLLGMPGSEMTLDAFCLVSRHIQMRKYTANKK